MTLIMSISHNVSEFPFFATYIRFELSENDINRNKKALRVTPAETRLTIYRRLPVGVKSLGDLGLNKLIFENCLNVRMQFNFDSKPHETMTEML